MEAAIRRAKSNLIISGYACVAFGVWGILKIFLIRYLDPLLLDELVGLTDVDKSDITLVSYLLMFAFTGIDFVIKVFVGIFAIREGRGKRTRVPYLFVASVYTAFFLVSNITMLLSITTPLSVYYNITTTIIDITGTSAFIIIIISALKLRTENS